MSAAVSIDFLRDELRRELVEASRLRWRLQGLDDGAAAYVIARLLRETDRPALVLLSDIALAEEFACELQTLLGERRGQGFLSRRVHELPARETPPLEMVSPPMEVEARRNAALYQLAQARAPIVVASVDAIAQRSPSPEYLSQASLYLVVGDEVDLDTLVDRLAELGYKRSGLVGEPGETAVRGGIIDVWPPGAVAPCRCELLGDIVESLRCFDPVDQRSFAKLEELLLLPVTPFPLARLAEQAVRRAVDQRCDDLLLPASERRQLAECLRRATRFPGFELLAPYACEHVSWLGDFVHTSALTVIVDPPCIERSLERSKTAIERAQAAATSAGTFFPEPTTVYVDPPPIAGLLSRCPLLELDFTETTESSGTLGRRVWRLAVKRDAGIEKARLQVRSSRGDRRFWPMAEALESARRGGARVILVVSDSAQLGRLLHLLELARTHRVARAGDFSQAMSGDVRNIWLVEGHLRAGFSLPADQVVVVTDQEIFGQRRPLRRARTVSRAKALTALAQIEAGDYLVHVDHGIGIYHGLKHLLVGETEGDFLYLEYAGGDRYYLPVDRINLVEKYVGSGNAKPALDRLGSSAWTRTKTRAKASILELARQLLDIEAFRSIHQRKRFTGGSIGFEQFEAEFPFEETEGQQKAIEDVVHDLDGEKPMDRLICGDVGYGKTEVAMRAAYLTAMGGRQVAFLVPTTVLARQHFDTLCRRFDGYPCGVGMLSRFNSRAENQKVISELAEGRLDIVVGTHRLLQQDVSFARLGLLVVDEEHRFGVKAKERIKRLRLEVDVLTMTATPIPRTLQLALSGVRDLSLIETAPVDRLAIRTYIARYDEGLIRQAIERELARQGQVFFVHNRVASIELVAQKIREITGQARVAVAHGQMPERVLDRAMLDFLEHRSDVLVCTSIIESGLDIPNANTILVSRADTFGLAQLYQIRGRVGRSYRRAYAYLLIPGQQIIGADARKRLAVLQQLDDLGSGFRIAAHDMEIRGAGNLLGKEQSGHVAAVGFELFMRMMEDATRELRGQPIAPHVEPEIELGADAFVPDYYIGDIAERLLIYKRMANADSRETLASLAEELSDRFGPLPRETRDFVRVMALRPALKALVVESLKAHRGMVALRFRSDSPVDRGKLLRLATEKPNRFRIRPGGVFTIRLAKDTWDAMVDEIETFLEDLSEERGEETVEQQDALLH